MNSDWDLGIREEANCEFVRVWAGFVVRSERRPFKEVFRLLRGSWLHLLKSCF